MSGVAEGSPWNGRYRREREPELAKIESALEYPILGNAPRDKLNRAKDPVNIRVTARDSEYYPRLNASLAHIR